MRQSILLAHLRSHLIPHRTRNIPVLPKLSSQSCLCTPGNAARVSRALTALPPPLVRLNTSADTQKQVAMVHIHYQLFYLEPMMSGNLQKEHANWFAHLFPGEPILGTSAPKPDGSACYRRIGCPAESPCSNVIGPVLSEAARLFHPRPDGRGIKRRFFVISLRVQGNRSAQDSRNSSKSAVARLGHEVVRFEDLAQSFFRTNGQDA
jgi:hypothetical protein